MKLVIFIPCLNEEETLPDVFATIPKKIKGIDEIEVVIVDDGSTDKTVEVAKSLGVTQFVRHTKNKGLAHSFRDGIRKSLELGADIIVLTDGDNQYPQERIPDLVAPIVSGDVDIVIADRKTSSIQHFSVFKKVLQRLGTHVLNFAASTDVPDATSGFRAWSREAAMQLNLVTRYSFGMETIIQAGNKRQSIGSIVIETNAKTRESRLFKSPLQHARRQSLVIFRSFMMYQPFKVFFTLAIVLFVLGCLPFVNYVMHYFSDNGVYGPNHIQGLLIGGIFINAAFFCFIVGVLADLIRANRSLLEDVLEEQRRTHKDTNRKR